MNPGAALVFRAALLLFGWIPLTGLVLHKLLVWLFVKRAHKPYGASSKFFTPEDLR